MPDLTSSQRKFLRGAAHELKPVVIIGQNGLGETVNQAIDAALTTHELIKVKFNDHKEKAEKQAIAARIEEAAGCALCGMIGHTAIFFRPHPEPEKRHFKLPS